MWYGRTAAGREARQCRGKSANGRGLRRNLSRSRRSLVRVDSFMGTLHSLIDVAAHRQGKVEFGRGSSAEKEGAPGAKGCEIHDERLEEGQRCDE